MLAISFNKTQDTNPIKAQNAGLIEFFISLLCKYSHINAHANGPKTRPIGQANSQITIHTIHHRFHRLDHQNFFVHSIGK